MDFPTLEIDLRSYKTHIFIKPGSCSDTNPGCFIVVLLDLACAKGRDQVAIAVGIVYAGDVDPEFAVVQPV